MGIVNILANNKEMYVVDTINVGNVLREHVIYNNETVTVYRDRQSDYDMVVDEIRRGLLGNKEFVYIQTTINKRWTNPYYFHLSGDEKYALKIYEDNDMAVYTRVNILEAIARLSKNDIIVNEFLDDIYELHKIPEYIRLKSEIVEV